MEEIVVIEPESDGSDKLIHQLNKLVLGVAAGFLVGELVKRTYDALVINRKTNNQVDN